MLTLIVTDKILEYLMSVQAATETQPTPESENKMNEMKNLVENARNVGEKDAHPDRQGNGIQESKKIVGHSEAKESTSKMNNENSQPSIFKKIQELIAMRPIKSEDEYVTKQDFMLAIKFVLYQILRRFKQFKTLNQPKKVAQMQSDQVGNSLMKNQEPQQKSLLFPQILQMTADFFKSHQYLELSQIQKQQYQGRLKKILLEVIKSEEQPKQAQYAHNRIKGGLIGLSIIPFGLFAWWSKAAINRMRFRSSPNPLYEATFQKCSSQIKRFLRKPATYFTMVLCGLVGSHAEYIFRSNMTSSRWQKPSQ